jgi:succinate-semialdehyde dehydrogenase / glutarate-semialdehyde dehydrogenase
MAITHSATSAAELSRFVEDLRPAEGIWIDGGGRAAATGAQIEIRDPATDQVVAAIADGGVIEARAAVEAASGAFSSWAKVPPRERSETLLRAHELMLDEVEMLTALISLENGKSSADARSEVVYAAEFFRWFSEECVREDGAFSEAPAGGSRTIVTHRPVGVAALVTPWNFPAAMTSRKVAPALAAGCSVMLKPAAETPLTALAMAQMLSRAGVPHGVVNLVPASDAPGIVTAWLEDPRVRKLSFTGSTDVGRILLRQAADRVVNTSMELGGNAPFIVADDADLDAAVAGAVMAKFRGGGQACTAANRFYLHASIAEDFTERFVERVKDLQVGPAQGNRNQIGPLISPRAVAGVAALVDEALDAGGTIAYQAELPGDLAGYFYPPTVLVDLPPDAAILRTEIFGPVVTIVTWEREQELLEKVNDTEFGLAAYIYCQDLRRAMRLGESVEAGMIGVNRGTISDPAAPFGGMKQSGIGREGAREGLRAFQETQYFSVDWR